MKVDEVLAYIDALPEPRRRDMSHLHDLLVKAVPELDVRLLDYSGRMIGYGSYRYRTKAGKEGDWFVLGLASRKSYISLYANAVRDGKYLPELYQPRLPGTKVGKSCINITKLDRIDDAVIGELARETYEEMKHLLSPAR